MIHRIYVSENWVDGGYPRPLTKSHPEDAGWDLYVSRVTLLPSSKFTDVHTDINIAMPDGLFGMITGRSSTIRRRNLRVETGIIDAGYRGELHIGVWNLGAEVTLAEGERIAQLLVLPVPSIVWESVQSLPTSLRGIAGFGSTGT